MCAQPSGDTGIYVDLAALIALEHRGRKVSFLSRQPVHSLLAGRFASRMRGRGLNFEEIRDYRPGDDVRSIDWKVTARLQKPHVRVFNEERDRPGILVVDQRLSMFFGSRRALKSVAAAEAAAIGTWRILGAGDRVGAIIFNDSDLAVVRPQRSRRTALHLLEVLATQNRQLGVGRGIVPNPDMLNRALDQARRLALHDAVVVIIGDFDGADHDTRNAVSALAAHNDVVAVLVHDPVRSQLPSTGRMTVTDGELQILLDVGRAGARQGILDLAENRLRDVFQWTHDFGVPVLPLSTAEDPAQQIAHLMGHRLPGGRGGRPGPAGGAGHG
ncbi:DUF58 domain-containing protein [Vineibacter terrae]|uniref:DUF58 domain-containing protein n=1 Tax=Vineibacter terrae TaxID=2586908 RepID=A0A5C8PTY5_9HYPH|nr:DUF58 domain-containing protein [Vineibacter terrae]TXL81544.1 DUF58 domain-containing protein [Vineibacter terrae]